MPSDIQVLEELNIEIGKAEDKGDQKWLDGVIASQLAFRRASGKVDDRTALFAALQKSGPRKTTVEAIEVYGDRAIVRCTVEMNIDGVMKKFDNLRLFIRQDGTWKLLGWANELLKELPVNN